MSSRRILTVVIASMLPTLGAVGAARAGTVEQAVESALQGNWGRMDEETRKVQVGRHGFTVDAITVQGNGGTVVATGKLFHRHRHAKSDLIFYRILVAPGSDPVVEITRIECRHWANKLLGQALEKGFKFLATKGGPKGIVLSEAGQRLVPKDNLYSKIQGDWPGASMTILQAIATRLRAGRG